ncbi:MAG: DndE family protein [Candidatus Thiothrix moscowensis]|nr:DndE family protein [Candidatus Thiothrix moscowensis]
MLPNRVRLSQKATDKLRNLKGATGLTPNILARIAIMLAIKDDTGLGNAGVGDHEGQELSQSVLFGEHVAVYDVMINQYIHDHQLDLAPAHVIAAMVEEGIHKMGHIKKLEDLCQFTQAAA